MKRVFHTTCGGNGWHLSEYLVYAKIPDSSGYAVLDLYQGSYTILSSAELYLLSVFETLDPDHPALEKFRKFGLIVNFNQAAALDAAGRSNCGLSSTVNLTICPTMGCNFDCPYCFEDHRSGRMAPQVQEQVVQLAEKLLHRFCAKRLSISWFGGKPLLSPDIIGSLSLRLIELANSKGAEYSAMIVTNGYLLNEENTELLKRCKVGQAQITLDGLEEAHDRTRHLAGGGKTFTHICDNLRRKLPFQILIRHNVHRDNLVEVEPLRNFTEQLAQESGNNLMYYPSLISGNEHLERRNPSVSPLQQETAIRELELELEAGRYKAKGGSYCGANILSSVAVDDVGRLYKCWTDVDKPERSYGTIISWDVDKPIASAQNPDILSAYLNNSCPTPDPECRDCLLLPICCGGCPRKRFDGNRYCLSFKDDPEAFALAVYRSKKKQVVKENRNDL